MQELGLLYKTALEMEFISFNMIKIPRGLL